MSTDCQEANIYQNISLAEMPEVLTAKHISAHLHVTPKHIYDLFDLDPEAGGIPSFRLFAKRGRRAYKSDYANWLEKKAKERNNGHSI